MRRDPYAVLGVARDATAPQIRAAYLRRARSVHPDIAGAHGLDEMRRINEAWAILKSPERRRALDRDRTGSTGRGPTSHGPTSHGPAAPSATARSGQPFWTGAAGSPPGRPAGRVLDFGIYAGWSLGEIAWVDRGYLGWLIHRPEASSFLTEVEQYLGPRDDESRRSRR